MNDTFVTQTKLTPVTITVKSGREVSRVFVYTTKTVAEIHTVIGKLFGGDAPAVTVTPRRRRVHVVKQDNGEKVAA